MCRLHNCTSSNIALSADMPKVCSTVECLVSLLFFVTVSRGASYMNGIYVLCTFENFSYYIHILYSTFWVGCPDRMLQSVIGKKVIAAW